MSHAQAAAEEKSGLLVRLVLLSHSLASGLDFDHSWGTRLVLENDTLVHKVLESDILLGVA